MTIPAPGATHPCVCGDVDLEARYVLSTSVGDIRHRRDTPCGRDDRCIHGRESVEQCYLCERGVI